MPNEGNVIVTANHKSNLDPIFVAGNEKREVAAIAKKELFEHKLLGYVLKKLNVIPINRENPDISTVKKILKSYKRWVCIRIIPRRN